MKAILTLLFVLIFGAIALAQNLESHDKIQSLKMGVVLVDSIDRTISEKEMAAQTEGSIARVYRFRNSRVKKALDFKTKKQKAKLA
ncbi:hypothetical protein [Maribacter halichondriae]|uniref:hypothetical protein n=1 Tax=Maribacter halichondriae TaxID=2980554 RepID=UPI002359AA9F|nr:hypothetical protein [Maribacter sp. Hal144]